MNYCLFPRSKLMTAFLLAFIPSIQACVFLVPFVETKEETVTESENLSGNLTKEQINYTKLSTSQLQLAHLKYYVLQLKDPVAATRATAATSVGEYGGIASQYAHQLTPLLSDKDKFVRRSAARSLGKIGNSAGAIVSALRAAIHDKDRYVAKTAELSLRQLSGS